MSSAEANLGHKPVRQYLFDEFTLDLDRGVLRRGSEEVPLRPKSFEALSYLVEHHHQLVAKSALIDAVWPDTAVGDNSLAQCLFDIRRALSDDSQQMIRTVPRRGYIFTPAVTTPVVEFPRERGPVQIQPGRRPTRTAIIAAIAAAIAIIAVLRFPIRGPARQEIRGPARQELKYQQITNFTDSVVSPALSPDGRMVAFIRGDNWFQSRDPIYVKILSDGEPIPITDDPRPKYGLAFSPDGSRIAYTVSVAGTTAPVWSTWTVSVLGGKPKLALSNSAGLTWLAGRRLLFSEIRTGAHMGVVTATESRSEYRKIYFPQDERGMAHLSYASPDQKWMLVVEMDPVWQPCRVVPMDGSSLGWQVGPRGKCTAAAWSPDGKWMYLGVEVQGTNHLWRQRFPKGEPEQITSGLTEEEGVAIAPDGRSLITSVGMRQTAVWVRDSQGEPRRPAAERRRAPSAWRGRRRRPRGAARSCGARRR